MRHHDGIVGFQNDVLFCVLALDDGRIVEIQLYLFPAGIFAEVDGVVINGVAGGSVATLQIRVFDSLIPTISGASRVSALQASLNQAHLR